MFSYITIHAYIDVIYIFACLYRKQHTIDFVSVQLFVKGAFGMLLTCIYFLYSLVEMQWNVGIMKSCGRLHGICYNEILFDWSMLKLLEW
jgi:hypothetical protein